MRIDEKKKVIDILFTIKEALSFAKKDESNSKEYISEIINSLTAVGKFIEEKNPEYNCIHIHEICRLLKENKEFGKDLYKKLNSDIDKLIVDIKKQLKAKLKVAFLPYNSSMWTTLESIWKAADNDEDCDAQVIPIPYYEMDSDKEKVELRYEGEKYPDYVKVIDYKAYDIYKECPDIIFIHNPFDDQNVLTRVPEEYYSSNLKKCTKMLVYSPYYTFGRYNPNIVQTFCFYKGVINADRVIAQNDSLKELYIKHGYRSEKILALGSPKIDAIVKMKNEGMKIPHEWEEKINGRPVFLLNTTLSFFNQFEAEGFKRVIDVYENVVEKNNAFLIWRPHPLTEVMIKNKRPEFLEPYRNMISEIGSSEGALIDYEPDYRAAFYVSKALLSSHSSLITEYIATGKPIYVIDGISDKKVAFVDYEHNYYLYEHDECEFVENTINGIDEFYQARKKGFAKSYKNGVKGNSGEKIYQKVKREVLAIV